MHRIRLLDILRGVAILGTLATNIWIFAHLGDLAYIFTYDHYEWWSSLDHFLRIGTLFLANGKFLGLLTILFGVGLAIKYTQAQRQGNAWPRVYLWISTILLLEGLIHYTLVMEYDILMSYALTAIIVSFIVKKGEKAIKKAMCITGAVHVILILLLFLLSMSLVLAGQPFTMGDMTSTVSLYQQGSWIEQIKVRILHFMELRTEVIFVIPLNIFLFLTGFRLYFIGAFSPTENGRRMRAKLMKIGLWLGVPLNLLIFVPGGLFDFPVRYLFAPLLSVAYLALLAKLIERNEKLWLWSALENVGKMALSCYVLQNILSSIIFYGWGFGLGGKVSSLSILGIWFMLACLQLTIATLWLNRFKLGPMEWARKNLVTFPVGGK